MSDTSDVRSARDLRRFLLGVGSWFGAFGLHGVLFSILLVVELQETGLRVGAAQSAILIPSVALMLAGGVVADHSDRRRLLLQLHAAAATLSLALGIALLARGPSYPLLIAYAVAMGALQAFINPTRDALLSEVAGEDLARPVALMNLTQWGTQAAGAVLAGGARWLGAAPFFFVQAALLAAGSLGYRRLASRPSVERPALSLRQLTEGIREVVRTPELLATWTLVCAVGVLFIGPFMVVFPLMVRDVYQRGAAEIGLVSAAFPLGTISGSLVVVQRGGLGNLMTSQQLALCAGAAILVALSLELPFWGVLLGVFVWGLAGSVFMIAGRTLFQQRASPANRGRVLATYTMGFMGAAGLLGAPLSGALARAVGPRGALAVLGSAMLVVVAGVAAAARHRLRRDGPSASPDQPGRSRETSNRR